MSWRKLENFPCNNVAIETRPGPRFIWTSAYASDDRNRDERLEQHLDAAAVPDRDLTRKHVGCDREKHWLMRKRAENSGAVAAGVGSIAKMTVEIQQPTAVMQQEPSPSPFSSLTAPMQGPTQNVQNEQMGFTDGNGSTGTQRAKESATE